MQKAEFDRYASCYDGLLRDPIRDRFTGPDSHLFHHRKYELIQQFFRRRNLDTTRLSCLDVGCGRGELLNMLRPGFLRSAGCDLSAEMMQQIAGVETRVQGDPSRLPFCDAEFDFVSAVCVYHHVPDAGRPPLTAEIQRVLRPAGIFCIIEHNPWNPITKLVVRRSAVDAGAVLLDVREARRLSANAGLHLIEQRYFLFVPQILHRRFGAIDGMLNRIPLGGQYAVFSEKPH